MSSINFLILQVVVLRKKLGVNSATLLLLVIIMPSDKQTARILKRIRALRKQLLERIEKHKVEVPKDAIKVTRKSRDILHREIHELMSKIYSSILNSEIPEFVYPSRDRKNVIYDPAQDVIFLKRVFRRSSLGSLQSVRKATILARILDIVHELLEEDIHATKREVFYNDVVLFETQRDSDEALEDVAAMMQVDRWSLHVVASAKGAVIGRLRFREGRDIIDCTRMGTGGKAITPLIDTVEILDSDAEFILVVEKEAAFIRLSEDRFYDKYPCIIITGKGQADIGTRAFLKLLVKELKLPVFGLVDSDPYGLHILLVYAVGSKRLSYESQFLVTPDIKWLGVRPSDLDKYNVPKDVRIPLSPRDRLRAQQLLNEPFIQVRPKYVEEIKLMLKTKEKAEIQALASKGFRFLTQKYLPSKLETGDWI